MSPRCLITGCDIVATDTGATAHGDLHGIGDVFVFNAVRDDHGETKWQYGKPPTNLVLYLGSGCAFERRGVIVFAQADAHLSDHARKYIEHAP